MKYIGLDLGSVTCGISKSDTGRFAMAVKTLRFKPDDYNAAFDMLLDYFEEEKPDVIVLGYPLLENGDEGPRASLSREFGEQLEIESGIKVIMQDERCTTRDSEEFLISAGVSRKKRKKVIDQQAAVRILQYYLDSINKGA
ncbi:MAG: Holliday junction resolvase RuvX [Solobacterium sp.]|nr:Holliday junction resolvase RuvX [Solobacterium sp.]MDY2731220.1 Holliday junction resolvase RuvX [Erysipelotrichaceae bacterium]MDD6121439.1 Holliday junction resolvase RuvX [Solobacterium sp.]MDD6498135.1 Holliday junction resolvase RuvX [Solobacterium sp.]MDD6834288.1 Holliday junction resolvase RuvX [Solobacterium sp.]